MADAQVTGGILYENTQSDRIAADSGNHFDKRMGRFLRYSGRC